MNRYPKAGYSNGINEKISDDVKSINNEVVGLSFLSLKRMYGSV